MSDNALKVFQEKFRVHELSIAETPGWILSVRPQQLTLGSMVLSVQTEAKSFAELTACQCQEMGQLLAHAEQLVKERLDAVRINVLCLMMQDPLLHFHVFPRYAEPLQFAGQVWQDEDWPGPPLIRPVVTDQAVLHELQGIFK
ncbi:hypothetical protein [Marinospirillum alkaliphilum]|uniref:Diadenosine tetraphosphate (Ap4A) hydrolase n=1 Tax=Marinospirillum alkaliphilum DSM 21637 TaxID=1122209 RepID=A0A1K1U978_9GAMM|nr:hypothetical protein [Marinospirillum alkaliphilum]SFX08933.1 Diadenosine tetraphosphate (Ap4A) hydrolase [Marinospirillum alkaliphilum DSM 21637]